MRLLQLRRRLRFRQTILICTRCSRRRWPARGNCKQAIAERKAALHLRANDADDWNNLGVLEARAGKIAEAREDFRHALQPRS